MTTNYYTLSLEWAQSKDFSVHALPSCESTNDLAKQQAFESDRNFDLYLTDYQSKGRGRGDHTWISGRAGSGLLSSWSFLLDVKPQPICTLKIGSALHQAARTTWPEGAFSLKAPNDLLLSEFKIGGLLVEVVSQGPKSRLVIGLGLNVLDYPKEIATARSLSSILSLDSHNSFTWFGFLDQLYTLWMKQKSNWSNPTLNHTEAAQILAALNANRNLKSPVVDISPQGDLVFGDKTRTSWMVM